MMQTPSEDPNYLLLLVNTAFWDVVGRFNNRL